VHEHQPLAEGTAQDGLVLIDLELDTDGLKADGVGITHELAPA
jgi:hypothetical protein